MPNLDAVLKLPKVRKIKTSVALPSDLLPKAHQIAKYYGLSMSEYLSLILRADVEKRSRDLLGIRASTSDDYDIARRLG